MVRSKKRKILVVTPTYPHSEKIRGVPGFIREICTLLAEQDYLVDVLAPYYEGAKPIARYNNITVYRFRYAIPGMHAKTAHDNTHSTVAANDIPPIWRPFYSHFLQRKLIKLIKLYDYEAIHAHWLVPQGWAAAKACIALGGGIPLICSAYGLDLRPAEGFERTARQLVLKYAKHVTVTSRANQERLKRTHPEINRKISVLPVGVDLATLFCRMPYVKRQKHALLFVGRLSPESGLHTLIKAMPLIQAHVPEIRLFVVGDGPDRKSLEEFAKEYGCHHQVQFIGSLAPPAVALFYNKARMVVIPTQPINADGFLEDEERMAQVCIEAMGCKCPVIISGLDWIREIVVDEQTGKVMRSSSPEDLSDKVLWVLSHPLETKQMVTKAHERVQLNFDIARCGDLLRTFLNNG